MSVSYSPADLGAVSRMSSLDFSTLFYNEVSLGGAVSPESCNIVNIIGLMHEIPFHRYNIIIYLGPFKLSLFLEHSSGH